LEKDNIKTDLRKVTDLSFICDCAFYMMKIMKEQNVSNPKDVHIGKSLSYDYIMEKIDDLKYKANSLEGEISNAYSAIESAELEMDNMQSAISILEESTNDLLKENKDDRE